jgi:diphosphomevalonate decarboxylase
VAPPEHWDLRLVVAVTSERRKSIGSTAGMNHTASTSPLYDAWLRAAPEIHDRVRRAVLARDFSGLARAAEHSALCMHGTALGAEPGIVYWNGATVDVVHEVRRMRQDGVSAFVTIDAGPHVKVFTTVEQRAEVERRVSRVRGVVRTIHARPGRGAQLLSPQTPVGSER